MKRVDPIAIRILSVVSLVVLSGCHRMDFTEDNFSTEPMRATVGYTTALHDDLVSLPPPEEKVIVAVYKFRDQTGQYKTSANATTFSTAVTQGATSMLVKALEDSGWFIPIEREGLPNLLNERKIIRSSRLQYESENGEAMPALPPLLYAGVLLEGGIVSYDTNFITGGAGLRYFGMGGSGQFRKDRVAIYLRLVSVKNGEVLKTVSTTKSILSKEVDFNVYRFVSVEKLFEAETGFSTNEPPSMCVLEAIEKAVLSMVIEGIEEGLWGLKNPQDINSPVIQSFLEERKQKEMMVAFDKKGELIQVETLHQPDPESVHAQLRKTVKEFPLDEQSGTELTTVAKVTEEPAPEAKILDVPQPDGVEGVADTRRQQIVEAPRAQRSSTEDITAGQFIIRNLELPGTGLIEAPEVKATDVRPPEKRPDPSELGKVEIAEDTGRTIVERPKAQQPPVEGMAGEFILRDFGEPGTELIEVPNGQIAERTAPETALEQSGPYVVEVAKDTRPEIPGPQKPVISYLQEIVGVPNSQEGTNLDEFTGGAGTLSGEKPHEVKLERVKEPGKQVIEKPETVADESKSDKSAPTLMETLRKSGFLGDLLSLNQKYLGFVSPKRRTGSDRSDEPMEEKEKVK
jgi:curli biogenesis system outer membrane secretion channel CsgG